MLYCVGACQHDGSEYHGNYVDHMTLDELCDWHRPRVKKLIECGVDFLAFETIPAKVSNQIRPICFNYPEAILKHLDSDIVYTERG